MLGNPLTHCCIHVTLDLDGFVAKRRVVECPKDVTHDFVDGNASIFPCVKNASGDR